MTVLTGHISPETAYVVADYPYGFRLRCQIRFWIETTKHGQRVVSQTTNPKQPGTVWNKPKASTYTNLRVLVLNEANGHVENEGLSFYADSATIAAFDAAYGEALINGRDQHELALLKRFAAKREALSAALKAAEASL